MTEQPVRLQRRPQFRDMPIPATALVVNGVPDFKTTDIARWHAVVNNKLCGLCGERLEGVGYFVGGPASLQSRCFFDPPMHRECLGYALEVCPFLACKKDYVPLDSVPQHEGYEVSVDSRQTSRPDEFYVLAVARYAHLNTAGQGDFLRVPDGAVLFVSKVPSERSGEVWETFRAEYSERKL